MKKTVIIVVLVIVGVLIGVAIYFSANRYYVIPGANGIAYEVDRKTGNTWVLQGASKSLQKGNDQTKTLSSLPQEEIQKITGKGKFDDFTSVGGRYCFDANLYNGTSWHIQEITVTITAKNQDGNVRWARQYKHSLDIEPLSETEFFIDVSDIKDATAEWRIDDVRGYP